MPSPVKKPPKPLNVTLPELPGVGTVGTAARHPITAGMTRELRHDVYDLDPKRIDIAGVYVRGDDESDEDFKGFLDAINTRQQIDVPISVRTTGSPVDKRYILVWGDVGSAPHSHSVYERFRSVTMAPSKRPSPSSSNSRRI